MSNKPDYEQIHVEADEELNTCILNMGMEWATITNFVDEVELTKSAVMKLNLHFYRKFFLI